MQKITTGRERRTFTSEFKRDADGKELQFLLASKFNALTDTSHRLIKDLRIRLAITQPQRK
jgi:hypothetical protein